MAGSNSSSGVNKNDTTEHCDRAIMENGIVVNEGDLLNDGLCGKGFDYLTTSATIITVTTGLCWKAFYTLTTTVFAAVTVDSNSPIGGTTFSTVTVTADRWIRGKFLTVTLTSGTVLAYKGTL
jgi:hypothetical protein